MSKLATRSPKAADPGYEADLYRWTERQGSLLRAGRLTELDRENLAEEIEGVGGSQKSEIRNRLVVLLEHLLKWHYQPEKRKYGWRATIVEQRLQIEGVIDVSPSLHAWPEAVLAKAYRIALVRAAEATGLPETDFPRTCPYTLSQILDDGFHPGPIEPRTT